MAYEIATPSLGYPSIGDIVTASAYNDTPTLGSIVRAVDPVYGEGEFIYLSGVSSVVAGLTVTYNADYVAAIATSLTTAPSQPLAVATAAVVGSTKGWFQISGQAVMGKANSLSLDPGDAIAVASGLVIAAATGNVIQGAAVAVVASAKSDVTSVRVMVNRPHDASDVS